MLKLPEPAELLEFILTYIVGPLSENTMSGMPCLAKWAFSLLITVEDFVSGSNRSPRNLKNNPR